MKPKVLVIIPDSNKELHTWLQGVFELKLIADIKFREAAWQNELTGGHDDWNTVTELLNEEWQEYDGFIIWAPEESVLTLAGYLSLVLDTPGKPIVTFQAPSPSGLNKNPLLELGLKSQLIKSAYLASSEIAEVSLLHGDQVFRPWQCHWVETDEKTILQSIGEPIATIGHSIEILKKHLPRTTTKPNFFQSSTFQKNLFFSQFQPGVVLMEYPEETKATILQAKSSHLSHPEVKQYIQDASKNGVSVILYDSQSEISIEKNEDSILIQHPHQWWITLLLQQAFSLYQSEEEIYQFIKNRLN
jgi:hypothetical protein